MFRSRASRYAFAALALGLCVVVVAVLAGSGGGAERAGGATTGGLASGRGDARARPPARRTRPPRRLSDAEAIERVRQVTPWVTEGHTRRKLVALTFDDGPGPITPALLGTLRRLHVPATFFQVAQAVHEYPDVARREHQRPFSVGSHTASHARLSEMGAAGQRGEIAGGAKAVSQNSGSYPRMFRPPYGAWNSQTVRELERHRMLMVLWSVTSRDWTAPGSQAIAGKVIREVRPGAIVLMHDFGGPTREPTLHALPRIVRALRHRGYRFVSVPQMMRMAPPRQRPPRPPSPYPA